MYGYFNFIAVHGKENFLITNIITDIVSFVYIFVSRIQYSLFFFLSKFLIDIDAKIYWLILSRAILICIKLRKDKMRRN